MQPKGGCMLLYFVNSKNGTKCKNFAVLLCFYVNTLILLHFLRFQKGGYSPPSHPLNPPLDSYIYWFLILFKFQNKDDMRADEFHHYVIHLKYLLNSLYVTIFGKIDHLRASTEITFYLYVKVTFMHCQETLSA